MNLVMNDAAWVATPDAVLGRLDPAEVERQWARLHRADQAPLPASAPLLEAWTLYHNGHFAQARELAERLGPDAWGLLYKATCVYATYVEPSDARRLALLWSVAEQAGERIKQQGQRAELWYWRGYALARYSQGISVAKALARGIGTEVRTALEQAMCLAPDLVDGHLALGAFHAEIIDKVGELIGGMTYGARRQTGLDHYERASALFPESPVVLYEHASGLLRLGGDGARERARRLVEAAERQPAADAMERLYVARAQADLDG
jgi:hypothetical protein